MTEHNRFDAAIEPRQGELLDEFLARRALGAMSSWGYATPHDKNGLTVYPHSKAKVNFDSAMGVPIESPEHFAKVVKSKMGSQYDENTGTFKGVKIHRWTLHKQRGLSNSYPAGWDGEISNA